MTRPINRRASTALAGARAIVLLGKIKGIGKLNAAVRHNHRAWADTRQDLSNVDPGRTHRNVLLRGAALPADVMQQRMTLMAAVRSTVRKDAVLAIEVVVSLPSCSLIDEGLFFKTSVSWIAQRFGNENIISAVVHNDESTPHLHALVLPIKDGRLRGSTMLGYGAGFRSLLRNFQTQVAAAFELIVHLPISGAAERRAAAAAVMDKLRADSDAVMSSAVFKVVEQFIANKPDPFVVALGLRLQRSEWSGRTEADVVASTIEVRAAP